MAATPNPSPAVVDNTDAYVGESVDLVEEEDREPPFLGENVADTLL